MPTTYPKPIKPIPQKDSDRFWSHVDVRGPDECWPWLKGKTEDGYGRFKYLREEHKANRIAYFLHTGDDPGPVLRVLHSCDYAPCCNPKHLRKGSVAENIQDRDERGRTATGDRSGPRLHPERLARGDTHYTHLHPEIKQGTNNGRAKLTDAQIYTIRSRYDAGERTADLAREYRVTGPMIAHIGKRRHWKHLAEAS